jgi:hypothetical protein
MICGTVKIGCTVYNRREGNYRLTKASGGPLITRASAMRRSILPNKTVLYFRHDVGEKRESPS